MSDTPRTDALLDEFESLPECERLIISFARQLERELAAANVRIMGFQSAIEYRDKRIAELETDAERYRQLARAVEFGDWGVARIEILDSFGRTHNTWMDDKNDMDTSIDAARKEGK